jgi:mRNA-degrading endonuclease toxin of MazEF toxin-antitoxin module
MKSPQRGEIWQLKADKVGKPRRILIVSRNELNGGDNVVAVPFFGSQVLRRQSYKSCVFFAEGDFGLEKDCVAKTDDVSLVAIRTIDKAAGILGVVDDERMSLVESALAFTLKIPMKSEPSTAT